MSLASLALCCGLAWWQWERFSSASGTFQNLGYVLQWPLFGLFPAFMFWRIRKLRRQAAEQEAGSGEDHADVPAPRPEARPEAAVSTPTATPGPAPARDGEPDDELAAYNRYLAELNARDQAR
ncbi:hypothetical protein GCM10009754_42890 [Amycolatopsis minnesotensis]|uniref:DNA-binding transcriptional regulator of glucitol operon n=1 Tax=Amycolatopsis minnesotensis TaxID=337894 RepID=A0ABP5CP24_9PSEU